MNPPTPSLDLDALEERAYRSRFDDGLIDLFLGLFLLLMGGMLQADVGGLAGVWGAMLIAMWAPVRKAVTEPRLGYVEFGPGRRAKLRRGRLGMILVLGATFLAGVGLFLGLTRGDAGSAVREQLAGLGPLPLFFMLALIVTVGATLLRIGRGLVYAALILAAGVLARAYADEGGLALGLLGAGALVLLSGVVLLVRFLRAHPRPAPGAGAGD